MAISTFVNRRNLAVVALLSLGACSGARDPQTPEQARARGDELIRKMGDTLRASQAFSFTVAESHERVRRNGEKVPYTLNREVVIRRPNRLWSHATGSNERNVKVTYDGKGITIVGDKHKVYATIPAKPTLDETLDFLNDRYDFPMPMADFLYSSPQESFEDKQAKGGWVKRVEVSGRRCEEVAYSLEAVDFTLSVTSDEPTLPCQLQVVYKTRPSRPVSRLTFSNWNLKALPQDTQFVAQVPKGYEQIAVIERIPKEELKADATKAMRAKGK
jgi:hypothetical protein